MASLLVIVMTGNVNTTTLMIMNFIISVIIYSCQDMMNGRKLKSE